jgi:hypothetical protein
VFYYLSVFILCSPQVALFFNVELLNIISENFKYVKVWIILVTLPIIALLPDLAIHIIKLNYFPNPSDKIRCNIAIFKKRIPVPRNSKLKVPFLSKDESVTSRTDREMSERKTLVKARYSFKEVNDISDNTIEPTAKQEIRSSLFKRESKFSFGDTANNTNLVVSKNDQLSFSSELEDTRKERDKHNKLESFREGKPIEYNTISKKIDCESVHDDEYIDNGEVNNKTRSSIDKTKFHKNFKNPKNPGDENLPSFLFNKRKNNDDQNENEIVTDINGNNNNNLNSNLKENQILKSTKISKPKIDCDEKDVDLQMSVNMDDSDLDDDNIVRKKSSKTKKDINSQDDSANIPEGHPNFTNKRKNSFNLKKS